MDLLYADNLLIEKEDEVYELDLQRNPFNLKCWLRYIDHKKLSPECSINMIYERSLKELPGSFKLWRNYLNLRLEQMAGIPYDDPKYEQVNSTFERALSYMHKMPRLWLQYLEFLKGQGFITRTRETFDRALKSLPITQVSRVWKFYLDFLKLYPELHETVVSGYRRYLKLAPEDSEDFIKYLLKINKLNEAATVLENIINDNSFVSKHGKSKHQLWTELCDLVSKNPITITSLEVEPIIRQGIEKYKDQVGFLWNSLADYYVGSGHLEMARDIYEEAMSKVVTVSDFSLVYDTYSKHFEVIIGEKMEIDEENVSEEDDLLLEVLISKAEDLVERRGLLQNSVCLRQNPHNVEYWHKRVKLYEGQPAEIVLTYSEALKTIDPKKATGSLHTLWVNFSRFYEDADQLDEARTIYDKGMYADFKNVDDMANLILKRVEMEERHNNLRKAIETLQRAVVPVAGMVEYHDHNAPVRNRVYKSHKIWMKLADMEQAFGSYLSCKSVFSRIMDMRIATPQDIVNCALYHEENNYFEEAFKAYERGIALFGWPNVIEIWKTYLHKFLERYKGRKLERVRDLFEQCLENCPAEYSKPFYLMYAKLEEDHGQIEQAKSIYNRATKGVSDKEKLEMFNIFLSRISELNGLLATRPIYIDAIESLPLSQSTEMALRLVELETTIGEIDRARAIYSQCSVDCDPRIFANFWTQWKDFEMKHGNESTISEMLRIRRSVVASMSTHLSVHNVMTQLNKRTYEEDPDEGDSMKILEKKARMMQEDSTMDQPMRTISFVRGETDPAGEMEKSINPDEIDINDDEEDDTNNGDFDRREIPSQVFGRLIPNTHDN